MPPRLVAALASALLLSLAPALSAVATTRDASELPPNALRYSGTQSGYTSNPSNGESSSQDPTSAEVFVVCDDDGCAVSGIFSTEPIPLVDGVGTLAQPSSGSSCAGDWRGDRTHAIVATATRIEWVYETTASALETCSPGSTSITWEGHYEFEGELVEGDPCLLDDSCPNAALPGEGAGGGSPRAFVEPTVFGGLATAAESATVGNLVWAALGTVVLALLIAVPTHFFNTAAETLSERIGAWWRRRRGQADAAPARGLEGWPWAGGGVLAAAVLAAFADPAFAVDGAGLRVLISIVASFGAEVVLGWVAVILIVRRTHPTAAATVRFAPFTLLLVAGAVLVTRMTGFEPPIVFGLVAGVAFGGLLATAEKARVTLIGLGWSFGIGLLAWLGYSLLPNDAVVLRELLSAAAIAGLSTLPIALLPVRGLAGRTVWDADRRVWGGAYAIGLFAFLLVLLPLPSSWAEVGIGLWTWVGLYLAYALAAVGAWLVVTRPWRREPAQA